MIQSTELATTKNLEVGDRVLIRGKKPGTLKYIGGIHIKEGIWCGIKLDSPDGKHDGKIEGKRYFKCQHRFGIFAPLYTVEKVIMDSQDSRRMSRQSIISTGSGDQNMDSVSQSSTLSEFSASSNSLNVNSPMSPRKFQPTASYVLKRPESSTSMEVPTPQEKLDEKDTHIDNLKKENEKNCLQLSESLEKVQDLKKQMLKLQQEYQNKEYQNASLIREQVELRQQLENLQFQLEEYRYPEVNVEILAPANLHRELLTIDEIDKSEEMKEKLIELESTNKSLIDERMLLQRKLEEMDSIKEKEQQSLKKIIEQLEKQIEIFKLQLADLQTKRKEDFLN